MPWTIPATRNTLAFRRTIITAVAALAVVGSGSAIALAGSSVPAKAALGLSFSADGNGMAAWASSGVQLTVGSTGTYAVASVVLSTTGKNPPAKPPSFTTDSYGSGSPRWVVELSNSYYLFGYPQQLGGGATSTFTGPQWEVNGPSITGCGSSYVTYAAAMTCADPDSSQTVTSAEIVEDADQTVGTTDTLTVIQYNGQAPVKKALYWHQVLGHFTLNGTRHAEPSGNYRIGGITYYWHSSPSGGKSPYFTLNGKRVLPASGVVMPT